MNVHVQYEVATPQDYIEAAELAFQMLANTTNEDVSFAARPLDFDIPILPSGQYDSAFIERLSAEPGTSFLVITARDLGATGLNFCYGRAAFNQGTLVASSSRVSAPNFVGLTLHEAGHSLGLVEPTARRHNNASLFIGHCANSCVMEPGNNIQDMNSVVDKALKQIHSSGFCAECVHDLSNRH